MSRVDTTCEVLFDDYATWDRYHPDRPERFEVCGVADPKDLEKLDWSPEGGFKLTTELRQKLAIEKLERNP